MNVTSGEKVSCNQIAVIENKQNVCDNRSNDAVVGQQEGKHVWISNIGRNIGAKQLRKHFGKFGTVQTVKILTNGKLFYGYILMGTAEEATQCINGMNNSVCEGYILCVSRNRPELRKFTAKSGPRDLKKSHEKIVAKKTYNHTSQSRVEDKTKKRDEVVIDKNENENKICELERKLRNAHSDMLRFKRRLDEYERNKNFLELNARKEMDQIRSERRRLNRDKEDFEKIKKDFEKRMSNDKASVMKELDEVKALRVKLQNRLDNFVKINRKSRSPLSRSYRNPIENASISEERRYRERNTINRKRAKVENVVSSNISPPSPPILSNFDRRGLQRSEQFRSKRTCYSEGRKNTNAEKSFSYLPRVNSSSAQNIRDGYSLDYRSDNSRYPDISVQPFARFGNAVQNVQPMLGPSRAGSNQYVPDYRKSYGDY